MEEERVLDPHKTILVVKHHGREVGRIPATVPNAEQYLTEMARMYGDCAVDYEPDPTRGLLALLHERR